MQTNRYSLIHSAFPTHSFTVNRCVGIFVPDTRLNGEVAVEVKANEILYSFQPFAT